MFRLVALLSCMVGIAWAVPTITHLAVEPITPWQGMVAFDYTLSETIAPSTLTAQIEPTFTLCDYDLATNVVATTFTTPIDLSAGTHRLIWNAVADGYSNTTSRVSLRLAIREKNTPQDYCVVNLQTGTTTYQADVPAGGWGNVDKTTNLVLRLIPAGTFTMGDQIHGGATYENITITKPYYIAVFETTVRQWELIYGSIPSDLETDFQQPTYPVACVNFKTLRGNQTSPSKALSKSTFLGKLRTTTNLDFDLPTEAEWELACRGGTVSDYNNKVNFTENGVSGELECGELVNVAVYNSALPSVVGSLAPNSWGLYDMHGNVSEWCRDIYTETLQANVSDPLTWKYSGNRVTRGGHFMMGIQGSVDIDGLTSWYRLANGEGTKDSTLGFRVVFPAPIASDEEICCAQTDTQSLTVNGEQVLMIGDEPVSVMVDPRLLGVATNVANWQVTLKAESTVLLTTNEVCSFMYTPHWYTNVLTHIVSVDGVKKGEITRSLVMTNGPETLSIAECLNAPKLSFTVLGSDETGEVRTIGEDVVSGTWQFDAITNHDGQVGLHSTGTKDDSETILETHVYGVGTISFWWKVSSEWYKKGGPYDYLAFSVDGEEIDHIDDEQDWTQFVYEITTQGSHTLRWYYHKDEEDYAGLDCGWLDEVVWTGAIQASTSTTDVPIPYTWLDGYPTLLAQVSGDYELAAHIKTGKYDASGNSLEVWHDYVWGTNPLDLEDTLKVSIVISNSVPYISWTPKLDTRVYSIWGTPQLKNTNWHTPTNSLDYFFNVKVEMP